MTDIAEMLVKLANKEFGTYDVRDDSVRVGCQTLRDAAAEIEQLRDQLPNGMKHCTIVFKECDEGHGRLTATNWVDNGCQICEIQRLQATVISQDAKLLASNPNVHVTPIDWRYAVYACDVAYTEIKHDPEPWGSAYAMNKENWT